MKTYTVYNKDNERLATGLFSKEVAVNLAVENQGWVIESVWTIMQEKQIGDFR